MNSNVSFLVKVIVLSALLSVAIKLAGPWISVPAGDRLNQIAIAIVLLPSLIIGAALTLALNRS